MDQVDQRRRSLDLGSVDGGIDQERRFFLPVLLREQFGFPDGVCGGKADGLRTGFLFPEFVCVNRAFPGGMPDDGHPAAEDIFFKIAGHRFVGGDPESGNGACFHTFDIIGQ